MKFRTELKVIIEHDFLSGMNTGIEILEMDGVVSVEPVNSEVIEYE